MSRVQLVEAVDPRGCILLLPDVGGVVATERFVDEGFSVATLRWWDEGADVADGEVLRRVKEARDGLVVPRFLLGVGAGGVHARMAACALPGFAGVVELYGRLVYPAVSPTHPAQPLDLLPGLACPYQGHFGERDATNQPHHMAELRRRLGFVCQPTQVLTYPGCGAGFAEAGAPGFDAVAAVLAWQRVIRFLDNLAA